MSVKEENRVILVSGANRGIGLAIARRLAEDGHRLSLGTRNAEQLRQLMDSFGQDRILCQHYDAREKPLAAQWVEDTVKRFGRIDGLVNNAGVFHRFSVEDGDEGLLDEMWEVNLKGPLRLFQAAFPYLRESGRGRVVNIASLSGKRIKSAPVAGYAMTKYALAAFSQAVRFSGWEHGIRSTAICPGYVATDMSRALSGVDQEEITQPESVAALVAAVLALPNTASVTELPVNCVLEHSF